MVSIHSLWAPILVSSVVVFLLSFIFHMVLPFHRGDYARVPSEDAAQEALRKLNIPPGDYMLPRPADPADMKSPEYKEKVRKGPVVVMTVMGPDAMNMSASLFQWFFYLILIGVLTAYITGRAVAPGEPYLRVFRFAGATSFIAYSMGLWQNSIWYKQKWSTTLKSTIDGFIYGLFTAGVFGWLWPR